MRKGLGRPRYTPSHPIAPVVDDHWNEEQAYQAAVLRWSGSLSYHDLRALAYEYRVLGNTDPACIDAQAELDRRMMQARREDPSSMLRCEAHQYQRGRSRNDCEGCEEARRLATTTDIDDSLMPKKALDSAVI